MMGSPGKTRVRVRAAKRGVAPLADTDGSQVASESRQRLRESEEPLDLTF